MRLAEALWRTARVPQSALNLTVPLLGFLLAGGNPISGGMVATAAGILALFCSILAFNNWAGFEQDRCVPAKSFAAACGRLGPGGVLAWSFALLAIGLIGSALVSMPLAALAAGTFLLWGTYSLWGKRHWGSAGLAHLLAGPAHLGLGALAAGGIGQAVWTLGFALGCGFVAGQWCQEILDRDADARTGVRSLAVQFGAVAALNASGAAFLMEAAVVFLAATGGQEPVFPAGFMLAAAGVLAAFRLLISARCTITLDEVRVHVRYYRWIHLAAGAAMAAWVVLAH